MVHRRMMTVGEWRNIVYSSKRGRWNCENLRIKRGLIWSN